MEHLRLLPLLASFQVLLPTAAPSDLPPPPPNITVTPAKTEYLIGDTVSIRCVAPWSKEKIQGFQFSGTSGWAADVRTTRRTSVYSFNVTGPKDGGWHACTYTVLNRFRRLVRSRESKAIALSVKDRPPQPTLALKPPSGVTIVGQTLVFSCAAPPGEAERRFHLYREKAEVTGDLNATAEVTQAQLKVRTESGQSHAGNFSCAYEEKTEGRWISSYLSPTVEVLVKEVASPPRLEVHPPNGVVSEEAPLNLTCVATREDFQLRFRFYRNGEEISEGAGGAEVKTIGKGAQLLFHRSPRRWSGQFGCRVEEEVDGTWVESPQSQTVEVTVKDLPSQPALLLDPPSGEVLDGDPLLLTCVAKGPTAHRNFSFYKDGAQQFWEATTGDRALFSIPVAKATHASGQFSCRFQEKLGDRWIPSPFSQAMMVTTQGRSGLLPLVGGCVAGGVAVLLALLLVGWLRRRRRGEVHWKGLREKDDLSAYPMANINGS